MNGEVIIKTPKETDMQNYHTLHMKTLGTETICKLNAWLVAGTNCGVSLRRLNRQCFCDLNCTKDVEAKASV